jgi:mRNA interferase MazF
MEPRQCEIWWGKVPDSKPRPYLILTRDQAIPVMRRLLVAPVSTRVRGIPSEIELGPGEGLPVDCAATVDDLTTLSKRLLVRRMGSLGAARRHELCDALRAATDC